MSLTDWFCLHHRKEQINGLNDRSVKLVAQIKCHLGFKRQ